MQVMSRLEAELDRWGDADLTLPIWWRDDDAIAPTPALDRLDEMARETGLDVHLAIIPAPATPDLGTYLSDKPHFHPVVHGWAHDNHAPQGQKNAEFGAHRPVQALCSDAARGLESLENTLKRAPVAMFVPPWNRISPDLVAALAGLGYGAVSTYGPRTKAAPGLMQVNTHIDPIYWRGGRGLLDPALQINALVTHLAERRAGRADAGEPLGLLTHHLVHDDAIWSFVYHLIQTLMRGPVQIWSAQKAIKKDTLT
ncbi:MAG: polysaccharide deacetylase family protein [Sedimentitalea sp.]